MDYQFLRDLPTKRRNKVLYLLLADHNVEAFFTAVRSGYKVDSWVLEWFLLSRRSGYIKRLLKEKKAKFTDDAFTFLEAYLGEDSYNNWLIKWATYQRKILQEKEEAEKQAMLESLKAQVEEEGFTPKIFDLFRNHNDPRGKLLIELYGEEKVYEEAKKLNSVWKIASTLSEDFLFSKKEYQFLEVSLENAQKLIKIGEFTEVGFWSCWDDEIKELLNKENPATFLELPNLALAYRCISKESKKNFTDEQWVGYYDRFHEDAWKIIPLEDKHYLVDAMTRAKRRKFLLKHRYFGKFFKTFFC